MELTVGDITRADVPAVCEMLSEFARHHELGHVFTADSGTLEAAFFDPRPLVFACVAKLDGRPVGFLTYFHIYSTFRCRPSIYAEEMYVRAEARRRGVCREMMNFLVAKCVEHRFAVMKWKILKWNDPPKELVRSLGGKEMPDECNWELSFEP